MHQQIGQSRVSVLWRLGLAGIAFKCVSAFAFIGIASGQNSTTPPQPADASRNADGEAAVEDAGDNETIVVKGETRVETSRIITPSRETPATVNTISSAQLKQRGIVDFVGAMQTIPGVNPSLRYGGFDHLTIRGFGGNDFLLLNDGFRDERGPMVGGEIPVGPMVGLDRIEIIKGPATLQYGPNALGGAINMLRKQPSATSGYEIGFGIGNFAERRGSLGITGLLLPKLTDKLTFRVDARANTSKNFRGADESQAGATAVVRWQPTRRQTIDVRGNWISSDYATDAGVPTLDGKVPATISESARFNSAYDYLRYRSGDISLAYVNKISPALTFQFRAMYQQLKQDYFSTEVVKFADNSDAVLKREFFRFDHRMKFGFTQAELRWQGTLGVPHNVIAGYDFSLVDFRSPRGFAEATDYDLNASLETQAQPVVPMIREAFRNQSIHSFHVGDALSLGKARLVAGARVDLYNVKRRTAKLDPDSGAVTDPGKATSQFSPAPSANVGLVYLAGAISPYASLTTSVTPQAPSALPEGVTEIKPERARQLEVGTRVELSEALSVQAALYQINKSNILVARPTMMFDQAGGARSRGAEAEVRFASERFSGNLGYALTLASYTDYVEEDVSFTGKRLPDVSAHTVTAWGSYALPRGFGISSGGRFVDRAFADRANTVVMPAYLMMDAAVSWQRADWLVTLAARNVLNRNPLTSDGRYYVSTIYDTQLTPGAPRTVVLSFELKR